MITTKVRRYIFPDPPEVSETVRSILEEGTPVYPLDDGDSIITFTSRWRLARLIEAAIKDRK